MIWYATSEHPYEVACREPEDAAILLSFGKYRGDRLAEVPESYLRWMLSAAGRAFLPDDLVEIVEVEARARLSVRPASATTSPAAWRPCVEVNTDEVLAWAVTAPAGEVLELTHDLRGAVHDLLQIVLLLEDGLRATADELIERLVGQEGHP